MSVSRRKIIKENQEYYFRTYANTVTRTHWGMSLIIVFLLLVAAMVDVLLFLRLSYIRQATHQFLEIDASEWAEHQLLNIRITLVAIFALVLSIAALGLWHYWKRVKSYNLYKQKRRYIWIVVSVATGEIMAACVITFFVSQSFLTAVAEFPTLVVTFLPMLSGARLLIPWEVTPLSKDDVELGTALLSKLFDWFSMLYLDKE